MEELTAFPGSLNGFKGLLCGRESVQKGQGKQQREGRTEAPTEK